MKPKGYSIQACQRSGRSQTPSRDSFYPPHRVRLPPAPQPRPSHHTSGFRSAHPGVLPALGTGNCGREPWSGKSTARRPTEAAHGPGGGGSRWRRALLSPVTTGHSRGSHFPRKDLRLTLLPGARAAGEGRKWLQLTWWRGGVKEGLRGVSELVAELGAGVLESSFGRLSWLENGWLAALKFEFQISNQ